MNLKDTLERLDTSLDAHRASLDRFEVIAPRQSCLAYYKATTERLRHQIEIEESAITLLKRYSEALEKIKNLNVDQDDAFRIWNFAKDALVGDLEPLPTQSTDEPTDEQGHRLG